MSRIANPRQQLVDFYPKDSYVTEVINALDKIAQSPTQKNKLDFLVNLSNININIRESYETTSYASVYQEKDKISGTENTIVKKEQDIMFNELGGLQEVSTGKVNAPFINLWHELGHKYNMITDPNGWFKRKMNKYKPTDPDADWDDEEEKYNTQNNEHPLADEVGGFRRLTHKMKGIIKFKTKSSTSTSP